MTSIERQAVWLLVFFLMIGLSVRVYSARRKPPVGVIHSPELEAAHKTLEKQREARARISINKATLNELIALPKVGPSLAKRILEAREKQGRFKDKKDLFKIPGIKEGVYRAIESSITFE